MIGARSPNLMTNTHSIQSAHTLATTQLKAQDIDAETAKLEAQLLLQHVLNVNRAWLIAHQNDALEANIHEAYRTLINRRINGEPIAYILGYREFYGLKLKVTSDTLIPRPDTETLVDAALAKIDSVNSPSPQPLSRKRARDLNSALDFPPILSEERLRLNSPLDSPRPLAGEGLGERGDMTSSASFPRMRGSNLNLNQELNLNKKMDSRFRWNDGVNLGEQSYLAKKTLDSDFCRNDDFRVLDLGTGTGAIALAIAKHRPNALLTAVDASQAPLDVAIENAQNLKITNVNFILSDWFSALNGEKFDVIVSNPPYIEANDEHLSQGDLRFEPISALASGVDGLDDIRNIITQAPQYLNPHGWLMLEHGYNQAKKVAALLKQAGFNQISHAQDLAGINRVSFGRLC